MVLALHSHSVLHRLRSFNCFHEVSDRSETPSSWFKIFLLDIVKLIYLPTGLFDQEISFWSLQLPLHTVVFDLVWEYEGLSIPVVHRLSMDFSYFVSWCETSLNIHKWLICWFSSHFSKLELRSVFFFKCDLFSDFIICLFNLFIFLFFVSQGLHQIVETLCALDHVLVNILLRLNMSSYFLKHLYFFYTLIIK